MECKEIYYIIKVYFSVLFTHFEYKATVAMVEKIDKFLYVHSMRIKTFV